MPLVSDMGQWTSERLRVQLEDLREQMARRGLVFEAGLTSAANPWALESAAGIARASEALATTILADREIPDTILAQAVNQLYAIGVAMPYFTSAARVTPPPLLPPPESMRPAKPPEVGHPSKS